MVWKKVNNADAGDADHFGGDDLDKVSDLFSDVDVDDVDFNSDVQFRLGKFSLRNAGNTFGSIINSGNVTADRTITLPTDEDTTLVGDATTQTVTNKTINATNNTIEDSVNTDGNYLRANGTKFVSSAIQYYDMPRAVFDNTNDIFFRSRNNSNDNNPLTSYDLMVDGYSHSYGYTTIEEVYDDMSSDNFLDQNITGVDAGVLKLNAIQQDGTNRGASYDMTTNASNSDWTFRFRVRINANTVSGDGGGLFCGLSSTDSATDSATNQDFVGIRIHSDQGIVGGKQIFNVQSVEADNQALTTFDQNFDKQFEIGSWYYWEIVRTTGSNFRIRCYGKDQDYGKLDEYGAVTELSVSISNPQSLRYIKFCNNMGSGTGQRDYEIDWIRCWKTIENPTDATPNLACNTTINNTQYWISDLHDEKVEKPILWLGNDQIYHIDEFDRYTEQEEADYWWESQDTAKSRVDIANDYLEVECVADGTNDSIITDVGNMRRTQGNIMNATAWELRFCASFHDKVGTTSNDAQLFVGTFNEDGNSGGDNAQDFTGWVFNADSGSTFIYHNKIQSNNAALNDSGEGGTNSQLVPDGTKYYFRLTRYSDTAVSWGIYRDEFYTDLISQGTYGLTAGIIGTDQRYWGIKNNNGTPNDSGFTMRIHEWSLVNQTSTTYNPPITGNESYGGIVPRDVIATKLNFNLSRTTETQIRLHLIRSPQPMLKRFANSELVRTIDIADFTDQVDRFCPNNKIVPVLENDRHSVYWWCIEGQTDNSVLAVNSVETQVYDNTNGDEVTYNNSSITRMLNTHLHYMFKKTTVDNQLDAA